ncbi:hypothetical protein CK203_002455 [Vitis vinifera]|uniref:DNA-directed RNA polymerase subunit n=1 Tax=Vitis vinifera TaxID=29760 RepID=A0A438KIG7_VITVI|nr:hypothetical protein CK203_002455 [Vitis vinifera]
MFFLSLIEHTLRLPPHLLDLSLDKTIQGELESQFLDKVIADLGLCISLSIDGDFVFPADGASTYTVYLIYFSFYNLSIRDCCIAFIFNRPCFKASFGFSSVKIAAMHMYLLDSLKTSADCSILCQIHPTLWIALTFGVLLQIRFQVQSVSYSPVPVEQPKESKPFAPMVILVSSSFELHPFKRDVVTP